MIIPALPKAVAEGKDITLADHISSIDIKQLRDDPDQQHPEFSMKPINSYKNQQQHRVLLQFRRLGELAVGTPPSSTPFRDVEVHIYMHLCRALLRSPMTASPSCSVLLATPFCSACIDTLCRLLTMLLSQETSCPLTPPWNKSNCVTEIRVPYNIAVPYPSHPVSPHLRTDPASSLHTPPGARTTLAGCCPASSTEGFIGAAKKRLTQHGQGLRAPRGWTETGTEHGVTSTQPGETAGRRTSALCGQTPRADETFFNVNIWLSRQAWVSKYSGITKGQDRRLVLNIEVCDSSRQRGATGLTIGKGRGFEGRSRDRLAAAKRKKQLQLGQVLSPASVFSASSPAARLGPRSSLLPGLLTSSQMPLGLEVSALHLPPAYDPVPVLDYPRSPASWRAARWQPYTQAGTWLGRERQPPSQMYVHGCTRTLGSQPEGPAKGSMETNEVSQGRQECPGTQHRGWEKESRLLHSAVKTRQPQKRCRCRTDDVLLVAPALAHPGGGNGCSGRRHAAVEPDPLFQLCWYAAWRRVSPLDEMLFPVAGSCIRSSPLRTAEPPASAWWAVFVLFSWASPRDFPTVLRADPPTGEPHRDQVLVLITGRAKIVHNGHPLHVCWLSPVGRIAPGVGAGEVQTWPIVCMEPGSCYKDLLKESGNSTEEQLILRMKAFLPPLTAAWGSQPLPASPCQPPPLINDTEVTAGIYTTADCCTKTRTSKKRPLEIMRARLRLPPPAQPAKQLRMVFVQRCRSAVLGIYQPPFQPAPCLSSARTFMVIAETTGAAAVLNHGREMALLALPRRVQTRQDPWHLLGLESQPCTHSTGMAPAAWAARSWFTPLTRPTAGAGIRPAAGVNRPMEIREKKHLSVISYNMGDVASCQFSEDANNPLTSYAKYRRVPALARATKEAVTMETGAKASGRREKAAMKARERAVTGDVQGLKFPAMQISTDAAKISAASPPSWVPRRGNGNVPVPIPAVTTSTSRAAPSPSRSRGRCTVTSSSVPRPSLARQGQSLASQVAVPQPKGRKKAAPACGEAVPQAQSQQAGRASFGSAGLPKLGLAEVFAERVRAASARACQGPS
ncbi:hypothetical protein Anapl_14198 [Anas platyrhynchos]|uniref:Uncharacterized protein n=1 Tax=Anas platyrhynchos TaxID=8839 RepID=R0L9I7_ANAPL|nr:hypothetical protein Anapl_14198 [Anas platyrhynchos]